MHLLSLDIRNFRIIKEAHIDFPDAVIGIITRHPMRQEELERTLARWLRPLQTGRVQQYLLMGFVLAFTSLFYYIYTLLRP